MGEWKRWSAPLAAAVLLALGLLAVDWMVVDTGLGASLHVAPRSARLCGALGCVDASGGGRVWRILSTIALGTGLLSALGLMAVAVMRFTHVEPGPIGAAVAWACVATAVLAVMALVALGPDSLGDLAAGGPLTVAGAIVGLGARGSPVATGVLDGGRSARPIRSTAVAPAAPAAPTPAVRPEQSPYDLSRDAAPGRAPLPPRPSKVARPGPVGPAAADATRGALRFVVVDGEITDAGLVLRVDRGGERALAWSDIVEVVARRMPPDPPYEKTTFIDLVVAGGPPARLLPTSRLDFAALPGGMAPNTKENWRRLVALARQHNPAISIEADSADFFAGGRDAPMFPALKKFVEWDRRYS